MIKSVTELQYMVVFQFNTLCYLCVFMQMTNSLRGSWYRSEHLNIEWCKLKSCLSRYLDLNGSDGIIFVLFVLNKACAEIQL